MISYLEFKLSQVPKSGPGAPRVGTTSCGQRPSYSPELNPGELLNADLKQRVTKTAPARTKLAPARTAIGALRSIQKQPERAESYFEHKNVCYAAA